MEVLDIEALDAALSSRVQATGLFETVNGGELEHMPGRGLRAATWFDYGEPISEASGLDAVSIRLDAMVRIYGPVHSLPVDEVDPSMLRALDALGRAYVGGFTLGGLVRDIDIFGRHGRRMSWKAGYLDVDAGTCRVLTLTLPMVINDVWSEVA